MKKLLIIYFIITVSALAKVDPPNYDFSLEALDIFMPGSPITSIEKKYGKGEIQRSSEGITLIKFYVAHIRYKFPVFVQIFEGKSLDFFARLPTYFLHDIFHQSLINRLGTQDSYTKQGEHAIYAWTKKSDATHTYCGSCTITCFPQYYTVSAKQSVKKFTPLINELIKQQ